MTLKRRRLDVVPDVKTVKFRHSNVVLTSCAGWVKFFIWPCVN